MLGRPILHPERRTLTQGNPAHIPQQRHRRRTEIPSAGSGNFPGQRPLVQPHPVSPGGAGFHRHSVKAVNPAADFQGKHTDPPQHFSHSAGGFRVKALHFLRFPGQIPQQMGGNPELAHRHFPNLIGPQLRRFSGQILLIRGVDILHHFRKTGTPVSKITGHLLPVNLSAPA